MPKIKLEESTASLTTHISRDLLQLVIQMIKNENLYSIEA